MAIATATAIAAAGAAATVGGAILDSKSRGDASDAQAAQNAEKQAFIKEQAALARQDILPLYQNAQDIYSQAVPSQLNAFQDGNYAAQQALLGGTQGPVRINADASFLGDQSIQDILSPAPQQNFGSYRDVFRNFGGFR